MGFQKLTYFKFDQIHYRVTKQLVPNLLLTLEQKFCFGQARTGQAKAELLLEVNRRFCTSGMVSLYI